ncbi:MULTISPECIES: hypothetical protein [unclassified Pseudonocardia]|uniref:hypothetical protein n=1 Tax=unclassified Pseudonocardia TaxID=2619320 RepID=UPI00094AF5FF|nr:MULTISPECIES: hypothetical protein [unclassified Pseudonocardia]OLM10777.1 hypothetical protein Ae505Ps2_0900 [Pseudonocardia sp. Ae505_Ps2]OLM33921.1 hypothetical protein Ae717Ps2_4817 [Pseudonocardia sp. Ae717_Ps2]
MSALPAVTACRGCCCGSGRKHPGLDRDHHDRLLDRLTDGLAGHARLRTSECLGPCADSDVLVVAPAPGARRAGARPVWLRAVLDAATTDAVAAWVRAGGPGLAAVPPALAGHVFTPGPRATAEGRAAG